MLALLTADAVVLGALDLLVVILALTVLGRPPGWAGYLEFAFGVGAVLAATVSAVLVGRRLGGPILAAALAFSGALAVVAFGLGLAGTWRCSRWPGLATPCWRWPPGRCCSARFRLS